MARWSSRRIAQLNRAGGTFSGFRTTPNGRFVDPGGCCVPTVARSRSACVPAAPRATGNGRHWRRAASEQPLASLLARPSEIAEAAGTPVLRRPLSPRGSLGLGEK